MKLYAIIVNYQGKDLDAKEKGWYITANNEEEVFNHLSKTQFEDYEGEEEGSGVSEWANYYDGDKKTKERIIKNKGDFDEQYMGEFYDIKYGWEEIGEVTDAEAEVLKKFKIL